MRSLTHYSINTGKLSTPLNFGVITDIHNDSFDDIWPMLEGVDALLVPGDISNRYTQEYDLGIKFLGECAKRYPTFFSLGNHEVRQKKYDEFIKETYTTGATILLNQHIPFRDILIGGWYKPSKDSTANDTMLHDFSSSDRVKLLLSHKPDWYASHIKHLPIDCIVSGHAHGGQIRFFNQGLYAPDQGFFPRYTKGIVDNRMVISTGASNPSFMPRINNPCEIVWLTLN